MTVTPNDRLRCRWGRIVLLAAFGIYLLGGLGPRAWAQEADDTSRVAPTGVDPAGLDSLPAGEPMPPLRSEDGPASDTGDVERRKLEHGTWWRVPGREAEPSEADLEAARADGRLVAAGVDDDEAFEEEHPPGPPPMERESLWSGVEVQVDVDRRMLAALAFVGVLVLAVLWRRR